MSRALFLFAEVAMPRTGLNFAEPEDVVISHGQLLNIETDGLSVVMAKQRSKDFLDIEVMQLHEGTA